MFIFIHSGTLEIINKTNKNLIVKNGESEPSKKILESLDKKQESSAYEIDLIALFEKIIPAQTSVVLNFNQFAEAFDDPQLLPRMYKLIGDSCLKNPLRFYNHDTLFSEYYISHLTDNSRIYLYNITSHKICLAKVLPEK